jgi:hypothetical protein
MYAGYLAFGDTVVIDNHMTQSYAETLGIHWLRGCNDCAGLEPRGRKYVTPLKDTGKPPWWKDGSKDAMSFLGLYGLRIDGADNSTREVDSIEGIADGGYVGSRRHRMRTLTVRAIAVAETDTALGFGLAWLRSLDDDVTQRCVSSDVRMYEACPCVCGPGCDDPACQQSCVVPYQRTLTRCRIQSGPTVLTRRIMPSGGAMAEVEFQIVAQNPHYISDAAPFVFSTGSAFAVTDVLNPAPPPDGTPTNPWVTPVESQGDDVPQGRTEWLRTSQQVPLPDGVAYPQVVPDIVLAADLGTVDDVRVILWDGPFQRAGFFIPSIPGDASVRVDFAARRVFTEWHGEVLSNSALLDGPDGGPFFWPQGIPATDLRVTVDRAPYSPPMTVEVTMRGADAA